MLDCSATAGTQSVINATINPNLPHDPVLSLYANEIRGVSLENPPHRQMSPSLANLNDLSAALEPSLQNSPAQANVNVPFSGPPAHAFPQVF